MDHCFVRLPQYFPSGNKTAHAVLDTLNPAFRQNFDNISPATIMNDRCDIGATGGTRLRPALARGAGLRRNGCCNRDKLLPSPFVRLQARHRRFDGPARLCVPTANEPGSRGIHRASRARRKIGTRRGRTRRPASDSSIVQFLYRQHQRSTAPSPAPAKTGANVMPAF